MFAVVVAFVSTSVILILVLFVELVQVAIVFEGAHQGCKEFLSSFGPLCLKEDSTISV